MVVPMPVNDPALHGSPRGRSRDAALLLARLLLVALFVLFGWSKLLGFGATIGEMAAMHLPLPAAAAAVAVICEFFVGLAIALGLYTRPLALLLAVYTLATAFIGHHYWTSSGAARIGNMIHFYKNLSIVGGFLLLWVTGPGRYSVGRD